MLLEEGTVVLGYLFQSVGLSENEK